MGVDSRKKQANDIDHIEKNIFEVIKKHCWAKVYDTMADQDIMKYRVHMPVVRGKKNIFISMTETKVGLY